MDRFAGFGDEGRIDGDGDAEMKGIDGDHYLFAAAVIGEDTFYSPKGSAQYFHVIAGGECFGGHFKRLVGGKQQPEAFDLLVGHSGSLTAERQQGEYAGGIDDRFYFVVCGPDENI